MLHYLTTGRLPDLDVTAWQAPWLAAALGPAIATVLAVPLAPLYQRLVGEITHGRLVELEDLSNPLLVQIATRAPGTWQHSLAMANLAEIAANAIGANGRLVRVGAYYHDLGKSLAPKYFIENLEPGETSPHDQMSPQASCDAIFAHVTEGLAAARRAGLHERIVDFMHMHHGNGVLEYFWARCREQGNPNGLTVEDFRYPGVPPHTRETAILAICDAVEAASRTLKKPDATAIDSLVQRIVYGKLHLGQLDDSGLSMSDLRKLSGALRETIRHANHGRIEYPWQREEAAASAAMSASAAAASATALPSATQTGPRLDSLDRPARPDVVARPVTATSEAAAAVDGVPHDASGSHSMARVASAPRVSAGSAAQRVSSPEALARTADLRGERADSTAFAVAPPPPDNEAALAIDAAPKPSSRDDFAGETGPAMARPDPSDRRTGRHQRAQTPVDSFPAIEVQAGDSMGELVEPPKPHVRAGDDDPLAEPPPPMPAPPRTKPPTPNARKRAATLPPITPRRAPTVPPPVSSDPAITLPRLTRSLPLPAPPSSSPGIKLPEAPWSAGLAARIDAAIDHSEDFGGETPVMPPTAAELRALLGQPDVTKRQTFDEIEKLHTATRTAEPSEPEILQVRRISPATSEVDPDDIESAIEIAPPARRAALAVGIAKKKPPA